MGCRASKVDDLPLVIRCRERKRLIKSAADYRYELSSSHLAYFHSLKDVGYALSRFVDEQLVIPSPSLSPSSPVLTLPSDVGRTKSSGSVDSDSVIHFHSNHGGDKDSGSESELSLSLDGHIHVHDNDVAVDGNDNDDHGGGGFGNRPPPSSNFNRPRDYNETNAYGPYVTDRGPPPFQGASQTNWGDPYGSSIGQQQPYQPPWDGPYMANPSAFPYPPPWGENQTSWGVGDPYAMDPSASQDQPPWAPYQAGFGSYYDYGGNSNSNPNPNQNVYYMKKSAPASHTVIQQEEARGFQETSQWVDPSHYDPYASASGYGFPYGGPPPPPQEPEKPKSPPPPPPPVESDYFSFFDAYDNQYQGYGYGYESAASSPDTTELREREGIPDLEEETETESHYEEIINTEPISTKRNLGEGREDVKTRPWKKASSSTEGSSSRMPSDGAAKTSHIEYTSSSVPSENKDGSYSVSTEVDKHSPETVVSQSMEDGSEGKKGKSFDIDEGSTLELESSVLSSLTTLSPTGSRDLHEVVNEIKDEFESAFGCGKEVAFMLEAGKLPYRSKFALLRVILSKILYPLDHRIQPVRSGSQVTKLAGSYNLDAVQNVRPVNLSSTLEKLYVWEKKLYKEVKGEERLRVVYERMCKRLIELDAKGAEASKIDAAQASIRRLTTKLNVSVKAIDSISCEIHKVRDKELQPQVKELIYGLIRMWQSIVKCHRRQFEAIMESRRRTLRANTSLERDSSLRTTLELETGLVRWAQHFNNWINAQKSYVNSLNGWLQQCIDHEPEVTIDGEVPFSPGRLEAPPIFIICNDWHREIKSVSQERVLKAMHSFAFALRQLLEREGDMQRLLLKNEQLVTRKSPSQSQNVGLDEPNGSVVRSEERVGPDYNEAMKLVKNGGLSSLQGGVIPIFKALEMFTRDALKAHERVRLG